MIEEREKKYSRGFVTIGASFRGCILVYTCKKSLPTNPFFTPFFCFCSPACIFLSFSFFLFFFSVSRSTIRRVKSKVDPVDVSSLVTSIPSLLITPSWPFASSCSRFDSIRFGLLRVCHRSNATRDGNSPVKLLRVEGMSWCIDFEVVFTRSYGTVFKPLR